VDPILANPTPTRRSARCPGKSGRLPGRFSSCFLESASKRRSSIRIQLHEPSPLPGGKPTGGASRDGAPPQTGGRPAQRIPAGREWRTTPSCRLDGGPTARRHPRGQVRTICALTPSAATDLHERRGTTTALPQFRAVPGRSWRAVEAHDRTLWPPGLGSEPVAAHHQQRIGTDRRGRRAPVSRRLGWAAPDHRRPGRPIGQCSNACGIEGSVFHSPGSTGGDAVGLSPPRSRERSVRAR
jgi:hypothetical protein